MYVNSSVPKMGNDKYCCYIQAIDSTDGTIPIGILLVLQKNVSCAINTVNVSI